MCRTSQHIPSSTHDRSDDGDPGVLVPGIAPPQKYFRNYNSIPQPGLNNQSSPIYSGAVVGGSTVVNGMFWNRGSAADYDSWAALGNPGWSWNNLLPYFKKSETFVPPPPALAEQYSISSDLSPHGTSGPVQVSFPVYQYPVVGQSTPVNGRRSWADPTRVFVSCMAESWCPIQPPAKRRQCSRSLLRAAGIDIRKSEPMQCQYSSLQRYCWQTTELSPSRWAFGF